MVRGFGKEEINASVELELLERSARAIGVRNRDQGVEAYGEETLDFSFFNGVENLAGRQSGMREFGFRDTPEVGNEVPVVRILDVAPSGQLVASLAVFASALAVALPRDRSVSAAGAADSSCREHQIDIRENVLNTLRVMFHASRMKQHRCFGRPPDLRSA